MTSYDEWQYPSFPYAQTHPDRLATIALIFGMTPPPIQNSRVLELGCAAGGNLIPMADTLPEASFHGIDLSSKQVEEGQRTIQALGMQNVELRAEDILKMDPKKLGRFDYIICHGVFSWVPESVQDRILEICRDCLTPQGVAYISYNTYPGWHMRGMLREILVFHARKFQDPKKQVAQSRLLLDFLLQGADAEKDPFGMLLKRESEMLKRLPDSYLLHEHLEEVNAPMYFYQFSQRAVAKGLQYLGESAFSSMAAHNFKPEIEQTLRRIGTDIIQMEQYMDFLRNRTFRQTLVCLQNVRLNRRITPDIIRQFAISSPLAPVSEQLDLVGDTTEQFRSNSGLTLSTKSPLGKAAMSILAQRWPEAVRFEELLAASLEAMRNQGWAGAESDQDAGTLASVLLRGYTAGVVELHTIPPLCVRKISERPLTTKLARFQALHGQPVTTLRHSTTRLADFARHVVPQLDGTRPQPLIIDYLCGMVSEGKLTVKENGQAIEDQNTVRKLLTDSLNLSLDSLAKNALLAG